MDHQFAERNIYCSLYVLGTISTQKQSFKETCQWLQNNCIEHNVRRITGGGSIQYLSMFLLLIIHFDSSPSGKMNGLGLYGQMENEQTDRSTFIYIDR